MLKLKYPICSSGSKLLKPKMIDIDKPVIYMINCVNGQINVLVYVILLAQIKHLILIAKSQ